MANNPTPGDPGYAEFIKKGGYNPDSDMAKPAKKKKIMKKVAPKAMKKKVGLGGESLGELFMNEQKRRDKFKR